MSVFSIPLYLTLFFAMLLPTPGTRLQPGHCADYKCRTLFSEGLRDIRPGLHREQTMINWWSEEALIKYMVIIV